MVFNFSPEPEAEGEQPHVYTWLIRFAVESTFDKMQHAVATALFEGKWGVGAWNKLKEDEMEYQRSAYVEDAEMQDIPEEEDDPEEGVEGEEEEESEEEEEEEEIESGELSRSCSTGASRLTFPHHREDEDERPKFNAKSKRTKNSQLAVGYKDDMRVGSFKGVLLHPADTLLLQVFRGARRHDWRLQAATRRGEEGAHAPGAFALAEADFHAASHSSSS